MLFCPKCGSMMKPDKKKGKKVLTCSCGHTKKKVKKEESHMKEKVHAKGKIEVVDEDDSTLPTTETTCPKCDHDEAYWWTKQMRSSDEPETKFLKCTECKHTWRE